MDLKNRLQKEKVENIILSNEYCNSFKFALESAHTHLECEKTTTSVYKFLNLSKPQKIKTSYTVPIMEEELLKNYLKKIERFNFIKIKVSSENAVSFVHAISKLTDKVLRIDGNEAWDNIESYKEFEQKVKGLNIEFIEQPFPAKRVDLYKKFKDESKFMLMADESIEAEVNFDEIQECFHGINVKLMKAGGYLNAIRLFKEAKKRNLKTMLGCMIETSLGISSAINLYELVDYFDLDGSLLIKNDPYGLISERDGVLF